MLFNEVIHAVRPYLMKDADVPNFMRKSYPDALQHS